MANPDTKLTIKVLLRHYGRTFAEELGIDAEANEPSPLFCLLVSALLASTRIGHTIALRAARTLIERGWTTPERMAATTWEERVRALDEAGYVRYDESRSTMLGEAAQMAIERYAGDLRNLREAAGRDPARERVLLEEFKGIGDVGANIFFREAQLAWTELFPFADDRVLAAAKQLGLPGSAQALAKTVHGRREFARLVAALIRVHLDRKYEEVRERAA